MTPGENEFDVPARARDIKERINKWDYIKLESYCLAKVSSTFTFEVRVKPCEIMVTVHLPCTSTLLQ